MRFVVSNSSRVLRPQQRQLCRALTSVRSGALRPSALSLVKQQRVHLSAAAAALPLPKTPDDLEAAQRQHVPVAPATPMARALMSHHELLAPIVKVFAAASSPNYLQPWQNRPLAERIGTGFAISGKRLLTNAHIVADEKYVVVRRLDSPIKFQARVIQAGHECDLALLSIDDDKFWEGLPQLEFGDVPNLQDEVVVAGYPMGGDNVSVTRGVVSRIDHQQYAHGATHLPAIQIDAAINPGNSGGPVFDNHGRVVGVAFQNMPGASSIGFIIPVPIIQHFLKDVEMQTHSKYDGQSFCTLGIMCQETDNPSLQRFLKMKPHHTGVVVNKILKLSPADGALEKNDVILRMDGHQVECDGSIAFRGRERIGFDYLIAQKYAGDKLVLDILRDGVEMRKEVTVWPLKPLVPVTLFDTAPRYYIFAGLVFVPLTQPYLHCFGNGGRHWMSSAPRDLVTKALDGVKEKPDQEVVLLSHVLPDAVNHGYDIHHQQVVKVNGVEVSNLRHLRDLVDSSRAEKKGSVTFELTDNRIVVLSIPEANAAHRRVLKRHRVPHDRSADLEASVGVAKE